MSKRASMNLLFFVRKNRILKSGEVSINVRISISGKTTEASIGINVYPDMWSENNCRANGNFKKAKIINNHIEQIITDIYDHYRSLALENKEITAASIKNAWLGIGEKPKSLVEVFKEHNDNMKKLIGIDFTYSTFQRYKTTLSHIKEFMQAKYGIDDIPFNKVDYKFIADLELHLKTVRKCCHNSSQST
ncbi:MAG: phage integrase SAM-like domain and Arm DNA-binding domain-containing protein [Bacteroidales bacterium]|nr:phage integrase SAM-like domain and Arm DNA-binding domain-containing protein [Bacteroidales bacterium]